MIAGLFLQCLSRELYSEAIELIEFFPYHASIFHTELYIICCKLSADTNSLSKYIEMTGESEMSHIREIITGGGHELECTEIIKNLMNEFCREGLQECINSDILTNSKTFSLSELKTSVENLRVIAEEKASEIFTSKNMEENYQSLPRWLQNTVVADIAIAKALTNQCSYREVIVVRNYLRTY